MDISCLRGRSLSPQHTQVSTNRPSVQCGREGPTPPSNLLRIRGHDWRFRSGIFLDFSRTVLHIWVSDIRATPLRQSVRRGSRASYEDHFTWPVTSVVVTGQSRVSETTPVIPGVSGTVSVRNADYDCK